MEKHELVEWESTYQKISEVLNKARSSVWRAVNSTMITAYWEIGRIIVEKEQQGREKAGVLALAHNGHEINNPPDLVKDPYVLVYVNYYRREITTPDENPPIGIILCAEKNSAVARYTLPEENKQIFISKYQLYLPTEEELAQELERERRALEPLMKEKEKEA